MDRTRLLSIIAMIAMVLVAGCGQGALPGPPPEMTNSPPASGGSNAATPTDGSSGQPSGDSAGLSGDIPIGAVWSITGAGAVYGNVEANAAKLAVDEINASSMLGQAKLKLVTEDDRSTKEGAIAAFEKLINQDKVVAILGPTLSNSARAADPVAQEKKVVVLGSNGADGLTQIGNFVFQDSLPESAVVPNTVKVTHEKLGYQKVAVIYGDDDAFTKSGYDAFLKALEDNGVTIIDTETFKKGDTDFSAQLTKIKGLNPDAIIVSALAEEAAGIVSQGRALGIPETIPFIGGNGFNSSQLAQLAGKAAEGAISGSAWFINAETATNQRFVKAYREKYNADPDQFAAQVYSSVYLLANAIKNAGKSDSAAIRDALAALRNVDTALGSFAFTENREAAHPPVVQIIKNGRFELYQ